MCPTFRFASQTFNRGLIKDSQYNRLSESRGINNELIRIRPLCSLDLNHSNSG